MNAAKAWRPIKIMIFFLIFASQHEILKAQSKEVPDSLVAERLHFIENTIKQDEIHTRRWWNRWLYGYGTATLAQGAIYLGSSDISTRQDMALGAATCFLGVAGQFISPLVPGKEREKLTAMNENTPDERMTKLTIAENLLREVGKREERARSWKSHVLPTAIDLSSGLVTWLGFDRSVWAGIGNFAMNAVITETQIWTQPILARRNYKKYQERYLNATDDLSFAPNATWYLNANAGGIGIRVVF